MTSVWYIPYIAVAQYVACWAVVLVGAVWAIRRWRKSESSFEPPHWKGALAFAALGLGGIWAILGFALLLWTTLRDKPVSPIWYIVANPLPVIVWCSLIIGPPAILVWVVRRWWRTSPRVDVPARRSYVSIAAAVLVGLSQLSRLVTGVWMDATEGFDNPVLMRLFLIGFLIAPTALLVSLFGKGTPRWPACGLSALTTIWWIFSTPWDM